MPRFTRTGDAVGTQHARQRMHHDRPHAEFLGQCAGMLRSRSAEHREGVLLRVVPASDRNPPHRAGHVAVRDGDQSLGELLDRQVVSPLDSHSLGEFRQPALGSLPIERKRKPSGDDPAQEQVAIRDRQRTTAPVTGRSRIGPCAGGADRQLHAIEAAQAPPAGGDGFDGQRRCRDANARLATFGLQFKPTVEARHIGTRAAHVEPDRPRVSRPRGGRREPDRPARWSGEDALLAREAIGCDESS